MRAVGLALLLLGCFKPKKRQLTVVTKDNLIEQLVMKGKQFCWQQCGVVRWGGVNTLHLISE